MTPNTPVPKFRESCCDVCGSGDAVELIRLRGSAYHQCQECGLIYANPMVSNLYEVAELRLSSRLQEYADKVVSRRARHRKMLKRLETYRQTGNFLEIGCNTGAALDAARRHGWITKGLDVSETATAYARDELGLDVFTGTVEEAGFPDAYFDVIYSHAVIEHVLHPLSLMQQCRRILRPGGVIYAVTVNWDSYTQQILGGGWRLLDPVHHVHLFTPQNVKALCERAGLEHVRTWTTGVRVRANGEGYARSVPWYLNLAKGPLSGLTRFTGKGDSIAFIARRAHAGP